MPKQVWVSAAQDEKGSFCDTESGHHYDNVSAFGATQASSGSHEAVHLDEPIDAQQCSGSVDDRYNLLYTETGSSGVPQAQKLDPGR